MKVMRLTRHAAVVYEAPCTPHPPHQPVGLRDEHVELGGEDDGGGQGGQEGGGGLGREEEGGVPLALQVPGEGLPAGPHAGEVPPLLLGHGERGGGEEVVGDHRDDGQCQLHLGEGKV